MPADPTLIIFQTPLEKTLYDLVMDARVQLEQMPTVEVLALIKRIDALPIDKGDTSGHS